MASNIASSVGIRTATPSPIPRRASGPHNQEQDKTSTGSWLCSDGPYREYIETLSNFNPGLRKPDPNNEKNPLKTDNALVVLLEAPARGDPKFTKQEFHPATKLVEHFATSKAEFGGLEHDRYRIYIMEGLAPNYVAAIGEHFFMEPTFFQRQERTCVWSNDFTPVSDALPHPSLLDPETNFHLQYCELRRFNKALENRYYFCQRTGRHVGMTAARKKEDTTTGIMRRKVGWWCRETTEGGWDVVILCDPPLEHLSPTPMEVVGNALRDIQDINTLRNEPFQEGYSDFLPPVPHDQTPSNKKHPYKSMLRDLVYYYQHRSGMVSDVEWKDPNASTIFLKKIVAAHTLQLVDYIKVMLPSLEVSLTNWADEQDQWKSLQTISRRCGNYRDDMEDTLLSLGYSLSGKPDKTILKRSERWKDCEKDFQYAYFRLKILKERADNLGSALTGLASLAGNRQNLDEAKRVKRLNILALLFIPLAYTSSLFSMQDNYAPNKGEFWVYWVSAIGVVGFTAAVTWILDSALNDKAEWNFESFRHLMFWKHKHKQQPQPGAMDRKGTGIYLEKALRRMTP
ncbi:hypothetical protein ACN47E_010144 [Coniothyrium glycines]